MVHQCPLEMPDLLRGMGLRRFLIGFGAYQKWRFWEGVGG